MPGQYTTCENDSIDIDPSSVMLLNQLRRYWWAGDMAAGGTFHRRKLSYLAHDVLQPGALGRTVDMITAFESDLAACLKPTDQPLNSTPDHEVVLKSGCLLL
jgi:hypothetical protein